MSRGPIHQYLSHDHTRLGALLAQATANPAAIDLAAYEPFRSGLLRHVAIEEKVLFADSRARRGGVRLPVTRQLHADHAVLASLLVPTPSHWLLETIRQILAEHDPLEEDPGGLYESCEQLAGAEIDHVVARMHAIPPVRESEHVDQGVPHLRSDRTSRRIPPWPADPW